MSTKFVEVKDHDLSWTNQFEEIKNHLRTIIEESYDIIHVGSTSVTGLFAKPIIDIDVVFDDDKDKSKLLKQLKQLGYIHEGNLGVANREAFGYNNLPFMKHHLYLVKRNSKAYKDHTYFKEYLFKNKQERDMYGQLKRALAKKYPYDIDAYVKGKEMLVEDILCKAYQEKIE